ncbi:MAG TPA: alpha-galactosidase [Myxococcota bacterium]|jgi:alpha-galactosidase|nr:alpha-galactosidase [Myxococcota bacterium]
MTPPAALVLREGCGRLEPVRLGLRLAAGGAAAAVSSAPDVAETLHATRGLAPGRRALGPLEVVVTIEAQRDGSTLLGLTLHNPSAAPVRVGAAVAGLRWRGIDAAPLRFLRHGWQSWSVSEGRALDEGGAARFPSGPWLRAMFHAEAEVPADRVGWHESELVTAVAATPGGPACVAGVLERGESFGVIYLRRADDGAELEIEWRVDATFAPGETRRLEPARLALGRDVPGLLAAHAAAHGEDAGARNRAPFQAGWCSWYHFFHDVTEHDLRRNLASLEAAREEIPIEVVQLDDGYQRAIGDWLETNPEFPSGLARLAREIRAAGFRPGLWTAPFCVAPESRVFEEHPEWLLRRGNDLQRGLHHAKWTKDGWIHVLDASRDDVLAHLERTFAALVEMGWSYQKLDFLYTEAMPCDAHDPSVSRAQRLRRGLAAVRRGCGDDAFLLGCGCPLGAAVGLVDGMRIGPDVAPSWQVDPSVTIPGLGGTQPATRNGVRNVLARAFLHRRLWQNDPDCLMTRTRDTRLTRDEARTLAVVTGGTGGMVIFSDDVPKLAPESRSLVRETIALAREVDAAIEPGARSGGARVLGLLDGEIAVALAAPTRDGVVVALVNGGDEPRQMELPLGTIGLPAKTSASDGPLTGPPGDRARELSLEGGVLSAALAPHASVVVRLPAAPPLAVFCDFDGTFAVQDVGSTLAKRHRAAERPAQLERLQRGELTPWSYNLIILDGMPLSEAATDAFLRTIELDPGAKALVDLCGARGLPFRVLSDGFGHNLERLQEIHGVRFAYDANRLWFEDDVWRIEAGSPNPACGCGTGVCKRARIEEFRREHPGTVTVHVGNGRVSDLCGALAADVTFAKDTLATALEERGVAYLRFTTLLDVVRWIERELS